MCIYIYIIIYYYIISLFYHISNIYIYVFIYLIIYLFIHTSTKESCTNTFERLTLIRILDCPCRTPSFMAPDSSTSWWMSSFVKRICWKISSKSPCSSTPTAAKRRRKEGQLGDDMEPLEMASGWELDRGGDFLGEKRNYTVYTVYMSWDVNRFSDVTWRRNCISY